MANTLLTIGMITKKAIQLFRNSNAFLQLIDKQYDSQYAKTGAKIGSQLKIRLPNDFTVRTGATASPQNTVENSVTMTLATQKGVDVSFSSAELALSLDDFSTRILAPMVNDLAGAVAADVMSGVEAVPNLVHATSGAATVTPTVTTWLQAGAVLDQLGAPRSDRAVICDPLTMARTVSTMASLFNPTTTVSKQFATGMIHSNVLGYDFAMDQTVILHQEGSFSAGTVNGGSQTGSTITTNAITGTLNVGDIISFAGVFGLNRITKASTGVLAQFVVTAAAASGATSISIYPALIPASAGAYATVSASPANSAALSSPITTSEQYRKNLAFHPAFATMATADLDLPTGAVVSAGREAYDGVSLRIIRDFNSTTDVWLTRLDILYGFCFPRPEWAVIVADQV